MSLIALIPARGGSKRLLNKNLLPIGGVPLVVRAIQFCRQFTTEIYVSSDSSVILDLADQHGAEGLRRISDYDDAATVDTVVSHFQATPHDLLLYQPTVVGVSRLDVQSLISANNQPTALAVNAHGIWSSLSKQVDNRVNSQFEENTYREVGVRYYPAGSITDGAPLRVLPLNRQVIDIDSPEDYLAAQAYGNRRHILFRYIHDHRHGTGHLRRALAIAERLQHHVISFEHVDKFGSDEAPPHVPFKRHKLSVDLIINDTLDTTPTEMAELRSIAPVIGFEDLGLGARLANVVINDLYPAFYPENQTHSGHRYSILRPEFLASTPRPIAARPVGLLVTFGGTDPGYLTQRAYDVFGYSRDVTYVLPPGWLGPELPFAHETNVAHALANSRAVLTSGGRTVYEAAATGTPAFVIAQNPREATHTHLGMQYGNHFLGLHSLVDDKDIAKVGKVPVETLQDMSDRAYAAMDRKGLDRVVHLIEGLLLEES